MGYTKHFNDKNKAIAYMKLSGFESVLMTKHGNILGSYSAISGYKENYLNQ
jgi:hypothetical protein